MVDSGARREPDGARPPISALAIVGLALAIIPGCPLVNLVGATLGVLAGRRIDAARGGLRGRGLARAAVIAGVSLALLTTVALIQFGAAYQQRNEKMMTETAERFIRAAAGDDAEAALRCWVDRAAGRPRADDVARFGAAVDERFGSLQRVEIPAVELGEGFPASRFEAALFLYFERETCTGAAMFQAVVVPRSLWPDFLLVEVAIDDEERGSLRLPAPVDG